MFVLLASNEIILNALRCRNKTSTIERKGYHYTFWSFNLYCEWMIILPLLKLEDKSIVPICHFVNKWKKIKCALFSAAQQPRPNQVTREGLFFFNRILPRPYQNWVFSNSHTGVCFFFNRILPRPYQNSVFSNSHTGGCFFFNQILSRNVFFFSKGVSIFQKVFLFFKRCFYFSQGVSFFQKVFLFFKRCFYFSKGVIFSKGVSISNIVSFSIDVPF